MPKKVYLIENLDCANCAAKIEAKFNALPEVEEAVISFPTKQLHLTAEDPDGLIETLTAIARTVESDARILHREASESGRHREGHEHHHDHQGCGCGHHHDHEACGCGHHHEHDHQACGCGHHHDHEAHHHDHEEHHHDHEEHHHDHEELHHDHEEHHHDHDGHDHHSHAHHGDGESPLGIVVGTVLFVLGLLLKDVILDVILWDISLSAVLFIAAYLILGLEVIATAARNLAKGHVLDENFLMSIATLGAFAIGDFAEAVGVMLFYRIGEYFEETAVARSRRQITEAIDLRPEVVILEDGTTIPAREAKIGDLLIVRPGDRVPLDGIVMRGESRIDTAPITGEPVPVGVHPGDSITSGCVNLSGQLIMRAERPLSESMVSRILSSVENAAAGKPKIDRFITRFARVYTPVVVALAAFVAVVPSLCTGNWSYWVYTALSFLVMSCPCALVLSVPLAFFSGIGVGGKKGILFKGGLAMEALGSIKAVIMDKTGTLTRGDFLVQSIRGSQETLAVAASCEQYSTHPIAASILQAAAERGLHPEAPEKVEEIAGHGIRATLNGKEILCGNEKLMAAYGIRLPDTKDCAGTQVFVAADGAYLGDLLIADTLKPNAKDAVAQLKRMGLHTAMLTGDNTFTAASIGSQVGMDEVRAQLLPEDKLTALQQIREKHGAVLYVGDGINDAPVLAGADVSAAMGSGADAAIEVSDVVFMTSKAEAIPEAVDIARETGRIAWQNVVFALAIKAIVMVLGLAGHASMWMAVFADSGVAMLCVLNSIRLLYRKK